MMILMGANVCKNLAAIAGTLIFACIFFEVRERLRVMLRTEVP